LESFIVKNSVFESHGMFFEKVCFREVLENQSNWVI